MTAPFPLLFRITERTLETPVFRITRRLASGPVPYPGPSTTILSLAVADRFEPRWSATERFVRWSSVVFETNDGAALVRVLFCATGAGHTTRPRRRTSPAGCSRRRSRRRPTGSFHGVPFTVLAATACAAAWVE